MTSASYYIFTIYCCQYDNLGRLKLKSEASKCLTPSYEGTFDEAEKKLGILSAPDKQKKNTNKYSKFMQVKLSDCGNSENQKWAWD